MKRPGLWIGGALALGLAGCAPSPEPAGADGPAIAPDTVTAALRDAHGQAIAEAVVQQVGDSLRVRIDATRMARGAYGAHLHTIGRCDAPGFTTAGAHWNPTGQQHGKDNPRGMHKGDLPNLMVGTDGRGSLEYTIPDASISGPRNPLVDADGAAVVIHAMPDDYRTDPSGNSGARIACGVLG